MKIKLSRSQWTSIGKKAGWMKTALASDIKPATHSEIAKLRNVSRPCNANDLILVDEGLQCGNCLAITRDHGKTWEAS